MKSFSLRRRLQSFGFALQGARTMLRTQHNAWIHAAAAVAVVVAGFVVHVTRGEWALLVVAITIVWMAEALNTAIEFLANEVSTERRERIGKAKDVGAFAVLVSALGAVIIGGLVFLPHLIPIK